MHLIKTFTAVIGLSVLNLQGSHPLSAETISEKPTAGKQSKQIAVDPDQELSYLIYLPESYEDTPEQDYPLVLFFLAEVESHGQRNSLQNGVLRNSLNVVTAFRSFSSPHSAQVRILEMQPVSSAVNCSKRSASCKSIKAHLPLRVERLVTDHGPANYRVALQQ